MTKVTCHMVVFAAAHHPSSLTCHYLAGESLLLWDDVT
jgi:hypothetical protein